MIDLKNCFTIILCLCTMACATKKKDTNDCSNASVYTWVDGSELAGCGWLLEDANENRFEPINADQFSLSPTLGQEIKVVLKMRDDLSGICMSGRLVEIECVL